MIRRAHDRHRHRDGADVEDRHDGRGERHADRQQHDEGRQDEDVADGVRRLPTPPRPCRPRRCRWPARATTNMSRQASTRTSPRGCARNLRQAAIMKNFMEMTAASHAEACTHGRPEHGGEREDGGEQRDGDAAPTARSCTNIASSSYSNSGFRLGALREACAQLADMRIQRRAPVLHARAVGRAGRDARRLASSPSPGTWPMQFERGPRWARVRPAGQSLRKFLNSEFINGLRRRVALT